MELSAMTEPQVTIVFVPRERFSCTRESLESIYEYTEIPFKLIYVDGNSPAKVRQYLQDQAHLKDFQIIRTDYYLSLTKQETSVSLRWRQNTSSLLIMM